MNHTDRYKHEQIVKEVLAARAAAEMPTPTEAPAARGLGWQNTMPLRAAPVVPEIDWCSCGACKETWGCPRCEVESAPGEVSHSLRQATRAMMDGFRDAMRPGGSLTSFFRPRDVELTAEADQENPRRLSLSATVKLTGHIHETREVFDVVTAHPVIKAYRDKCAARWPDGGFETVDISRTSDFDTQRLSVLCGEQGTAWKYNVPRCQAHDDGKEPNREDHAVAWARNPETARKFLAELCEPTPIEGALQRAETMDVEFAHREYRGWSLSHESHDRMKLAGYEYTLNAGCPIEALSVELDARNDLDTSKPAIVTLGRDRDGKLQVRDAKLPEWPRVEYKNDNDWCGWYHDGEPCATRCDHAREMDKDTTLDRTKTYTYAVTPTCLQLIT